MSLRRVFSRPQSAGQAANTYSDSEAHAVRFATPAERVIEQLTADLLDAQRFIAKLQQAQQDSETQIRKLRGLGDYKAAHDRLAKELSQSQKQCQSLAAQLQATHSALNHSQGSTAQTLAQQSAMIEEMRRKARSQDSELPRRVATSLATLQEQAAAGEAELLARLREQASELASSRAREAALAAQVEAQAATIRENGELVEEGRQRVLQVLDSLSREGQALESQRAAQADARVARLESELADSRVRAVSLAAALEGVRGERSALARSLDDVCARAERLAREVERLRGARGEGEDGAALDAGHDDARDAEVRRLLAVIEVLRGEVGGVPLPRAEAVAVRDSLAEKLAEQASSHEALLAAYADLQSRVKALSVELDAAREAAARGAGALAAEATRSAALARDLVRAREDARPVQLMLVHVRETPQEALASSPRELAWLQIECQRLGEENEALAAAAEAMQEELRASAALLRHSNPNQKIQYTQRLKLELEALRKECAAVTRERFTLEQCIRYLAVLAGHTEAAHLSQDATGLQPRVAAAAILPKSLAGEQRFSVGLISARQFQGGTEAPEPLSPRVLARESSDVSDLGLTPRSGTGTAGGERETVEVRILRHISRVYSTELSCSKKILVTLTLANNKLYASDELQFTLSCVNSATGVCPCPCDYATDATCTCRDLARNMTISMTKGAVYALYPLTFSRRYQGAPTETIVTTTVENCNDEYGAVAPTCGWATLNGVNVLDSQGFCCECTLVNGYWTNYMRGSLYCPAAAGKSPSQYLASAHCLRFNDDWWFVGYVVGNYQMDFNIAFNVTTTKTGGTNATSETLTVNPSVPIVRSADKTVTASLLGDLASYSQIPNLANHYLMVILDSLSDTPSVAFSKNKETWMLLDPALVDPAGLTCDKVGITYSGFRVNLADKCNIPNGYCLRNQLVDLYYADVERINAGHDPLYFVTKYSGGVQNERQMTYSLSSSGKTTFVLNLPVPSLTQSLVTLAVSADSVQFVSNTSPAKIQSTQLCTLYDVQCGTFESLEGSGYLTVTLENTGTLTADYYVSLTSCSDNVVKALAQYATIKAGAKYNFVFTITMATDQATSSTCSVEVRDSQGDLLDSTAVTWATLGTDYGQEPQEGTASPPVGDAGSHWCWALALP
ncbi:hypothetical protein F751_4631 [Auxenochlorella protothecoides]|uniref:Generative cell specific-1/HAP2 domain-containing protein n=1 Tax=Auxenochlorella protothecoides TaxID=3075 RepID=A0A087SNQ7_AUXPR|nr:hypothetical protein F751_4631 [Auxenochlorella protothecoides]KFM27361.1 hypothetical protein F751_4631 [Auxenochlorella protothecoides]